MKITIKQLEEHGACIKQVRRFKRLFGSEVSVTKARCLKHTQQFDFNWAAFKLLSRPARAEYNKARMAAWAEYDEARMAAWAEYDEARMATWAEHKKALRPAWAEYNKAKAAAWAEYNKARALAFWRASKW